MKMNHSFSFERPMYHGSLVATLLILAGSVLADGPELSPEEKAQEFEILFNGKDLTGWREVQGQPGTFHVEDGAIVTRRRKGATAYWLSTSEEYGDFQLRLQYMLNPGGNSGIFIRVPSYEGRTSKMGMEIQLLDDGAKKGKPSKGSTGSIYRIVAPSEFVSRPAGQWNELEIYCKGDQVRVTLNGKVITDASMADYEELKNHPREGYIGLSAHTHETKFRNVRLRRP